MNWQERKYTGKLGIGDVGATVNMMGWIDTIRDHGNLIFAHLRDIHGVIQLVFDPGNGEAYKISEQLRSEYVVELKGIVTERTDEAKNPNLPTGSIEINVQTIQILSTAKTPPFMITEKEKSADDGDAGNAFNVDEDIRMTYRYLDLRRKSMQANIINRHRIANRIRNYLSEKGFLEIETPVLTKSTPEGARDYVVPSRVHDEKFFALPQSPQLFKQLLMISGFERYYQIVRCFRDEDLRPNRQPEFTQMDLEASFIDETFIYGLMEGLMTEIFEVAGKSIKGPFPKITYDDAIAKYGNDHPDLRFGLEMTDITSLLANCNYNIFKKIVSDGGLIKGINVKGESETLSKSYIQNELASKVIQKLGGKGLSWMKMQDGKLHSNIVQFFNDAEQAALIDAMDAENGDVLFFVADVNHATVNEVLGRFRLFIADKVGLTKTQDIAACWVVDFPLFERKEGRLTSIHHPFTAPDRDILSLNHADDLLDVKSRAYDLVINGEEVGGGSIRIHNSTVQAKIFDLLGLNTQDIEEKFGFFVRALDYGTPPHGGLALGVDRLVAMILDAPSIREVIAFPKNRMAYCPLTQAPGKLSPEQLAELKIKTIQTEKEFAKSG